MVNPIFNNMVGAFARAGEKLTRVALDANPETASGDLASSIIDAKQATAVAEASAAAFKTQSKMEKDFLDIIA